jgi:hypothetical protein
VAPGGGVDVGGSPVPGVSGAVAVFVGGVVLVAFSRRRPAAKIAATSATAPTIRTQPHHERPPPPEVDVAGVVWVA